MLSEIYGSPFKLVIPFPDIFLKTFVNSQQYVSLICANFFALHIRDFLKDKLDCLTSMCHSYKCAMYHHKHI